MLWQGGLWPFWSVGCSGYPAGGQFLPGRVGPGLAFRLPGIDLRRCTLPGLLTADVLSDRLWLKRSLQR